MRSREPAPTRTHGVMSKRSISRIPYTLGAVARKPAQVVHAAVDETSGLLGSSGELKFGHGLIATIIALSLGFLCLLGVLAFHFPEYLTTPELRVEMAEGEPFIFMKRLAAHAEFGADAQIIALDGLRVEFPHGWGLVRASNTTPSLTLRFEADHADGMSDIQDRFRQQLLALQPDLILPF